MVGVGLPLPGPDLRRSDGAGSSNSPTVEPNTTLLCTVDFSDLVARRAKISHHPLNDDGSPAFKNPALEISNFSFSYRGGKDCQLVLHDLTFKLGPNLATAIIGPSGCGKSTLLRAFNRMHDEAVPSCLYEGEILFHGENILRKKLDCVELRRCMGYVAQKASLFPNMSIWQNVEFGLAVRNMPKSERSDRIEAALKKAQIFEEVKDKLGGHPHALSGGQQQRLCIARAIVTEPEVLLLDEPCSALDPISTAGIEELIHNLKRDYTIVIVTHNMQQAARIADYTLFMYEGRIVEYGSTEQIFISPLDQRTEEYVTGRFG